MKTLIYQQVHIKNEDQGHLFAASNALLRRLNPGIDVMVIDNASPIDARRFVSGCDWYHFKDSIGHFSPSYAHEHKVVRDGPGRAHSYAWRLARALGYRRTFYCEADCLFAFSAEWGFSQLQKPIGAQPECKYYAHDWHVVWIADIPWFVDELRFPDKYHWETRKAEPAGEAVYEEIMGEHIQALPVRGIRGETVGLNAINFREHFPDGCDITTHVETAVHAEFLRMNGHADLIPLLGPF